MKSFTNKTICVPGSKSHTNRALIMAALTQGSVSLKHPLYSEDTEAMIKCLKTLGLQIETNPNEIIVNGCIDSIEKKHYELFAKDSGTTVRFLLALLCIVPGIKILRGTQRLNERPIKDLVNALRKLGAQIEYTHKEGQLPVKISSSSLSGSSVDLKSDISSQFCSALLLISPSFSKSFTLRLRGQLISKPYVEMTLSCMREGGIDVVEQKDQSYFIAAKQSYLKKHYRIEGDFSSAGYFFALAALTKSAITVKNLDPFSPQADRKFLDILKNMGHVISYGDDWIQVEGKELKALDLDMENCPDQVMTMAVLAAFAPGATRISGVRSLRVKETERVEALKKELGKMGIRTEDTHDTLTIYGGSPHGATIDTYNDHRIAMAFAIASFPLPKMVIRDPQVVGKTFPDFWTCLASLR
jgi:3-phosphoshikimate 1-carboxyvinyltransferase